MGYMFTRWLLIFLLIVGPLPSYSNDVIHYPHPQEMVAEDIRASYYLDLLELALEKTRAEYGGYELVPTDVFIPQTRAVLLLSQGKGIDLLWTMTSADREELVRPIRIPLMKGLLGVRVAVIRREDQKKFAQLREVHDWLELKGIQGHDWPDTKILVSNGFNIIADTRYQNLFEVLEKGRIDYFPRGVLEAWAELQKLGYQNLMVEPNWLITYRAPIYFFVHKHNERLAERVELGLRRALESGEFGLLLRNHPNHREAIQNLESAQRKIIRLPNPLLTAETPIHEESFWYRNDLFN